MKNTVNYELKAVFLHVKPNQRRQKIDNRGSGHIFICSCSQTVKTIDFKINKLCRTRINEYNTLPIMDLPPPLQIV